MHAVCGQMHVAFVLSTNCGAVADWDKMVQGAVILLGVSGKTYIFALEFIIYF